MTAMRQFGFVLGTSLAIGTLAALVARAQPKPGAPVAAAACAKPYAGGKCCEPGVAGHLPRAAVFGACGESDATYLGEKAGKDTCSYMFRVGEKDEAFVEVYAPAQKDVPSEPNDPFFSWKKVGKVFVTDKAKSPKSRPMLAGATGLWLPGAGYMVSVRVSTKVCSKAEAMKLAKSVR